MASRFGNDTSSMMGPNQDQIDLSGSPLSEEDLLIQNAWRKISTPSGALFWAPNNTTDARELLKKGTTEEDRASYARFLESLFRNDSRCFARCTITLVSNELFLNLVLISRKDGLEYEANFQITPYQIKIVKEA